jgi:AcrR family transcriptional regulator
MPRPAGRRNPDYDTKRATLVRELTDFVMTTPGTRPSFRQLSIACAVTEPTLKHYFVDREGVAIAILEELGRRGAKVIAAVALPAGDLAHAVDAYIDLSRIGIRTGVFARAHCFGIVESVADERVARAYLEYLLEPSLQALEKRLGPHFAPDGGVGVRAAALMLFAPLLLAVIHQQVLGGDIHAPMDLDSLFQALGNLARSRGHETS